MQDLRCLQLGSNQGIRLHIKSSFFNFSLKQDMNELHRTYSYMRMF